jgi:Mannosyl-glycoprotein endo-beta-N-acetylglucosaminidase
MLKTLGRSLRRAVGPLLLFSATIVGSGAIQQARVSTDVAVITYATSAAPASGSAGKLGQDDPALSMRSLSGLPGPGTVAAVDADASQPLPVWVQAHRATTLWSGPDESAVQLTDLPQWTFLKVAGVTRGGRLLVNYAGDYATRQPGVGWVEQPSVGPAGDPGIWVTNYRATALWSGVDDKAARFTNLPQWTKLQIVAGAPPDAKRVEVRFFGDGATRQPGMAWIARADVGPITPPVPLPALAAQAWVVPRTFASDDEFINAVGTAAQSSFKRTGVPASITVAQAILESDWGRSRLTRQGNNLFGVKSLSTQGPAGVMTLATWEHVDGDDVVVRAPFKAYYTLDQSIDDHAQLLVANKRYANALTVNRDPRAFAEAIQDDGYATDPNYASKLVELMDRYNLYRFDSL